MVKLFMEFLSKDVVKDGRSSILSNFTLGKQVINGLEKRHYIE